MLTILDNVANKKVGVVGNTAMRVLPTCLTCRQCILHCELGCFGIFGSKGYQQEKKVAHQLYTPFESPTPYRSTSFFPFSF